MRSSIFDFLQFTVQWAYLSRSTATILAISELEERIKG